MSYPSSERLTSLADSMEPAEGPKIPLKSRSKKRGADDFDESTKKATKRTARPKAIIDESNSELARAKVSKPVKPSKGKAVSNPESVPTMTSTRPRRNTKPAIKDDADLETPDNDEDPQSEVDEEKGVSVNKVAPRLIDGHVVGIDLTPEEFLEKQKRGHWGTGRIGKNKSPTRRKRRVGPTPNTVDEMDEGDWIIVNMRVKGKPWKDIDTAWSVWNDKLSSVMDHSVVRNRYEKLESMLCAELNLDANTNILLGALYKIRDEKVRKSPDEKFEYIAAVMKDIGAKYKLKKKDFTPIAISVRYHFLISKKLLNDDLETRKWRSVPLDIKTPGAATAIRTRAPKKRNVPSSTNATQDTPGEPSANQDNAKLGELEDGEDKQELNPEGACDGGADFEV